VTIIVIFPLYVSKGMKTFKMSINYQCKVLSSSDLVINQRQKSKYESPYSHTVQATLIQHDKLCEVSG